MNMIIALFFQLFCTSFLPPAPGVVMLKHIDGKASGIASDQLQNLYVIKNDVLEKYDESGKFLFSYSNNTLGRIDFVDPSDPMKVLVLYKAFPQFLILDNTLSESAAGVPLQQYGLEQVNLVCTSHDRGYWVYNPANMELLHLSADDLVQNKSTGNISQLLNLEIHPNFLTEQNNRVFLNDPQSGILVFDNYGTYYKTVPLKGLNEFQVNGELIFYLQGNTIRTYNYRNLSEESTLLPDTNVRSMRIEKERLFILNSKGVDIYSIH
jgi:hypothetical protein